MNTEQPESSGSTKRPTTTAKPSGPNINPHLLQEERHRAVQEKREQRIKTQQEQAELRKAEAKGIEEQKQARKPSQQAGA